MENNERVQVGLRPSKASDAGGGNFNLHYCCWQLSPHFGSCHKIVPCHGAGPFITVCNPFAKHAEEAHLMDWR